MTRGQANVIRAFSIWTVYVWVTRMWNIARDDQSIGFKAVHIYQNVATVDVKKGYPTTGLADILENLYIYWVPGREPPPLEVPAEEAPAAAAAAGTDGPAVSGAASRVPAHLLERSRLAK